MHYDSLFAFTGIWDRWKHPLGEVIETCSILTTTPNALLADVHDRMPVILPSEHYDLWLAAAMWTAERISRGESETVSDVERFDSKRL